MTELGAEEERDAREKMMGVGDFSDSPMNDELRNRDEAVWRRKQQLPQKLERSRVRSGIGFGANKRRNLPV